MGTCLRRRLIILPWGSHKEKNWNKEKSILEQMFKSGFIDEEEKERAGNLKTKFSEQNIGLTKAPRIL